MREQLEKRLEQLKAEFEAGQKMLAELEAKQANIRETMLRMSGAIQVLEEELAKASQPSAASGQPNGHDGGSSERAPEAIRQTART